MTEKICRVLTCSEHVDHTSSSCKAHKWVGTRFNRKKKFDKAKAVEWKEPIKLETVYTDDPGDLHHVRQHNRGR